MNLNLLVFFCFSLLPMALHGHGDLHERIEEASKQIKTYPDSALLYFARGQLYLQHEDYKKSIKDFKFCKKLGLEDVQLEYNLASVYYAIRDYNTANDYLDKILNEDQQNVKALRLKGQTLLRQNRNEEAALAFENVINYAAKTLPENYIEASIAWENCNTSECKCLAGDIIYSGIETLGSLRIFYQRLVALSLAQGDYRSAIYYQSIIINQSNRKEWALYERALNYLLVDDFALAKNDLINARSSILRLKPRLRNHKATKDLLASINQKLSTL